MREFNISSFIKIIQNGLSEDNTQEATGRLLLDSIAKHENVCVDVSGKMITNLVKRKADVHEAIKTAAAKAEITVAVINYFKAEVIKKNKSPYFSRYFSKYFENFRAG